MLIISKKQLAHFGNISLNKFIEKALDSLRQNFDLQYVDNAELEKFVNNRINIAEKFNIINQRPTLDFIILSYSRKENGNIENDEKFKKILNDNTLTDGKKIDLIESIIVFED